MAQAVEHLSSNWGKERRKEGRRKEGGKEGGRERGTEGERKDLETLSTATLKDVLL
jgi:hypothetical protein